MGPRAVAAPGAGAGAAAGAMGFLSKVPLVGAEETRLDPEFVRFRPEIEPLVRLLDPSLLTPFLIDGCRYRYSHKL